MMPPPIWFVVGTLLGWPALQLLSVWAARGRRKRLRALVADLTLNARPSPRTSERIAAAVLPSKGEPALIVAPLALPLAILAGALAELFGRERPSRTFRGQVASLGQLDDFRTTGRSAASGPNADPRLAELRQLSEEIGFIRMPTTVLLTLLTCLPVLPVYLLAYGARATLDVIPKAAILLARTVHVTGLGLYGTGGR